MQTREPAAVAEYLERLGSGSQRAIRQALDRVASVWLGREGTTRWDVDWARLDSGTLGRVRDELIEAGAAPATINKFLSAAKGVLSAAERLGAVSHEVAAGVRAVPWVPIGESGRELSRTLTRAEVSAIFESCARRDTSGHRRDVALVAVFLACGPRRAEVTRLRAEDADLRRGRLRFRSDDPQKSRLVPLPVPTVAALRTWVEKRGPRGLLFPAVRKNGHITDAATTDQAVYDQVRRIGKRAGVADLNSRCLRRTCVVALIRAGLPLPEVQQRLGHASWLTTVSYSALAAEATEAIDLDRLPYRPPRTINRDQPRGRGAGRHSTGDA